MKYQEVIIQYESEVFINFGMQKNFSMKLKKGKGGEGLKKGKKVF